MIYTIAEIDWESFPDECPCPYKESDLPFEIRLEAGDVYRTDAALCGILAHSPYCPYCTPITVNEIAPVVTGQIVPWKPQDGYGYMPPRL
jgi:hypothetical protein